MSFCLRYLINSIRRYRYIALFIHFSLVIEFYLHVAFCQHVSQQQTPTRPIHPHVLSTHAQLDRPWTYLHIVHFSSYSMYKLTNHTFTQISNLPRCKWHHSDAFSNVCACGCTWNNLQTLAPFSTFLPSFSSKEWSMEACFILSGENSGWKYLF